MKAIKVKRNKIQITIDNKQEEQVLLDALILYEMQYPRRKKATKMFWTIACAEKP